LAKETSEKDIAGAKVLTSEINNLNAKAKKLANMYAWILYNKRSIPEDHAKHCTGSQMFKSKIESFQKSDSDFYENIIRFSVKILEGAFEK
jgi:hypothetical protein